MNHRLRRQRNENEDRILGFRRSFWVLAVVAYLVIGIYMVWLGRDQMNPDAVSYIQIAEH